MSVLIEDKSKGFNGSFEHSQSQLPVNWQIYNSETVPSGDFDIILDNSTFKDGRQSLKFIVRECSNTGGWHSPGIAKEISGKPGDVYSVSFWTKNQGSEFIAQVAGVSAFKGYHQTIVKSAEENSDWKYYEYSYVIPENMKAIRFEMNVLQEGTLWIDDVKIGLQDK